MDKFLHKNFRHLREKRMLKMLMLSMADTDNMDSEFPMLEFEQEVDEFIENPSHYLLGEHKSINYEQVKAIAQAVCAMVKFMDDSVCPFVRELP